MTWEYMAGFFDGEGSIGLYLNQGSSDPRYKSGHKSPSWIRSVSVVNTYMPILLLFKQFFGGRINRIVKDPKYKPCYQWQVSNKPQVLKVLTTLLPYLQEKRSQAELMIRECSEVGQSEWIAKRLKELKHETALVS